MKIIKFDTLYPSSYIEKRISQSQDEIQKMNYIEFHQWLIKLRITFSDYYSFNLMKHGWDSKEIFLDNKEYKRKCEKYYFGYSLFFNKLINRFKSFFSEEKISFKEKLIKKIINVEKPDVIFIREQTTIRSKFWEQFNQKCLIVCRMDCPVPRDWSPYSFDLIYSNIPTYISFFKTLNLTVKSNSNGFDKRVLEEVDRNIIKKFDVSYIGGLGSSIFKSRTMLFEKLLQISNNTFSFSWWGYKMGDFDKDYPFLSKTYMGEIAGLEMFQVYADSKIILNDYGDVAENTAVNMRIFEAMGVGSFLLTRKSSSLTNWENLIDTYIDEYDCLNKILLYLENEMLREEKAKNGQNFILSNFNYENLMLMLSDELTNAYKLKFNL